MIEGIRQSLCRFLPADRGFGTDFDYRPRWRGTVVHRATSPRASSVGSRTPHGDRRISCRGIHFRLGCPKSLVMMLTNIVFSGTFVLRAVNATKQNTVHGRVERLVHVGNDLFLWTRCSTLLGGQRPLGRPSFLRRHQPGGSFQSCRYSHFPYRSWGRGRFLASADVVSKKPGFERPLGGLSL